MSECLCRFAQFYQSISKTSSNLVHGKIEGRGSREQIKERKHEVSHSLKGKFVPKSPRTINGKSMNEILYCTVGQQKTTQAVSNFRQETAVLRNPRLDTTRVRNFKKLYENNYRIPSDSGIINPVN